MNENFIKRLMASLKCGVCGQCYQVDSIKVLGHRENLWFLSAFCPACHSRSLMAAVIKEGKLPEVITDLTEAELDKIRNRDVPTADEVLDMHSFLKAFDGDFARLFDQS